MPPGLGSLVVAPVDRFPVRLVIPVLLLGIPLVGPAAVPLGPGSLVVVHVGCVLVRLAGPVLRVAVVLTDLDLLAPPLVLPP